MYITPLLWLTFHIYSLFCFLEGYHLIKMGFCCLTLKYQLFFFCLLSLLFPSSFSSYLGENGHLSLLPKLFSKMSHIWNDLGKWPVLKLDFLKIKFQFKTQFLDNRVIVNWKLIFFFLELVYFTWNSSSKKKKKKISKSTFAITRCSKNRVLHLKLDL